MTMAKSKSIATKALLMVVLPLLLQVCMMAYLGYLLYRADQDSKVSRRSREIIYLVDSSEVQVYQLVYNSINYDSTGIAKFKDGLEKHLGLLDTNLSRLLKLLESDPQRERQYLKIKEMHKEVLPVLRQMMKRVSEGDKDYKLVNGFLLNYELQKILDDFVNTIDDIGNFENGVLGEGPVTFEESRNTIYLGLLMSVVANLLLAVFLVAAFNATITKRLKVMLENSVRLAGGMELHPAQRYEDEIGELDRGFHRMAEVLEESRLKERAIIDNATDMICTINLDFSFVEVNPAFGRILGYDADDLQGRKIVTIVPSAFRDGLIESLSAILDSHLDDQFECSVQKKDGTVIVVSWNCHYSKSDDSFYCVLHDITARKAQEELIRANEARIRLLIENMPVGVISFDEAGKIESINPKAAELFNCRPDQLLSQSIVSIVRQSQSDIKGPELSFLLALESEDTFEMYAVREDGEFIPIESSLTRFAIGDMKRFLITLVDISDRKEAEQLKRDFVAMVSHDLRTPLTSVRGFLELLDQGMYGELNQTGGSRRELACRNVDRLLTLVRDLLDIEKLESGGIELEMKVESLKELIDGANDAVAQFAEDSSIELVFEIEDMLISIDKERMLQVLVNILSNAIKFSSASSRVTTEARLLDDNKVEIRVTDSGPGIEKEAHKYVFERFKQAGGTSSKKKGSGLGLAIAKKIVEQHKGSIGVDSEPGKGSSFWVVLPVIS